MADRKILSSLPYPDDQNPPRIEEVGELCDYYVQALQVLEAEMEERYEDGTWVRQKLPVMEKLLQEMRELLAAGGVRGAAIRGEKSQTGNFPFAAGDATDPDRAADFKNLPRLFTGARASRT